MIGIISFIIWGLLAIAILATWIKVGEISEKLDEVLKRLPRPDERPSRAPQRDTITCIRCLGQVPADAAKCPHCGTIMKG